MNELLDCITTLGVATDYNRIGLKPDQREINSPPVTHQISVVEEQSDNSPPILRMDYVWITELTKPDTRSREDAPQVSDLEPDSGSEKLGNIPEAGLLNSETLQALGLRPGQDSDLNPPTRPDASDLSHIRQLSQETIHHFWARFLLVMNKVKDCLEEDAISFFCRNCTDKGILNAISRHEITRFADLVTIVQKYYAMESA